MDNLIKKIDTLQSSVSEVDKQVAVINTKLQTQIDKHIDNKKDIEENDKRIKVLEIGKGVIMGISFASSILIPTIISICSFFIIKTKYFK